MATHSTTYHFLTCTSPIDNIVEPECGMRSDGGWGERAAIEAAAIEAGWSKAARGGHCCPMHTKAAATAEVAPRPRKTKAPADAPFGHFEQDAGNAA